MPFYVQPLPISISILTQSLNSIFNFRYITSTPPVHVLPLHFDYSTPIATSTVDLSQHLPSASKPLFTLIREAWTSGSLEDLSNIDGYDMDSGSNDQYRDFIPPEYFNPREGSGPRNTDQQPQQDGKQESSQQGKGFTPSSGTKRRLIQAGQRVSPVSLQSPIPMSLPRGGASC